MSGKRGIAGYALAGLSALALAGCSAIPTPQQAPPGHPAEPVVTPPPVAVETSPRKPWDERELDSGAWRYEAANRRAVFVPTGGSEPLTSVECRGGEVRLNAMLLAVLGSDQFVDVDLKTSFGTDRLRFQHGGVSLPARDPRLDRIAFSRGRFALEAVNGGGQTTLPVQPEIGRVIEDCR